MLVFSLDDSETERDEQSGTAPAPSKKKCLFDDSIFGKVGVDISDEVNMSTIRSQITKALL